MLQNLFLGAPWAHSAAWDGNGPKWASGGFLGAGVNDAARSKLGDYFPYIPIDPKVGKFIPKGSRIFNATKIEPTWAMKFWSSS